MKKPRIRIILQARTSSTRLPAKVLLPIAGMPLAILCAKRLGNTGREVILATSDDRSDDILANIAFHNDVKVFRGSLNDVLDRFLECSADLSDEDIVVRATADNPFPDGDFIDRILSYFVKSEQEFLGTSWPEDGLPYGLSSSVFKVGALRSIAQSSHNDPVTREHVTTQLRKITGNVGVIPKGVLFHNDYSHLRVTIDTIDDYLSIATLFQDIICPDRISWRNLVERMASTQIHLNRISKIIINDKSYGLLTLGTAQLGFDYGITNYYGCPSDKEVYDILCLAKEAGITHLDTARVYGDAEARIGRFMSSENQAHFNIISKLPAMTNIPDDASKYEISNFIDANVYASCRNLGCMLIDVMMIHRFKDMTRWEGAIIDRLSTLMDKGVIGEIGVSVYTPEEAMNCMTDERISHLQIPFNLLDNRWLTTEFQKTLDTRDDIKIHARSIFLQGLLINPASRWPDWATESYELVKKIENLTKKLKRKNKIDLCLSYVRAHPRITSCVIGIERVNQLAEIISYAHEPPLTPEECLIVQNSITEVSDRLINPSLW